MYMYIYIYIKMTQETIVSSLNLWKKSASQVSGTKRHIDSVHWPLEFDKVAAADSLKNPREPKGTEGTERKRETA